MIVTMMRDALPEDGDSGSSKIDVWDFGAEQLDSAIYNNKLTVDIINDLYPGISPGTTGKPIAGFSLDSGEFIFNDGGKTTSHRLRSINSALTRYDDKSLTSSDLSTTYTGYLYSNAGSNKDVYIGIQLNKNDILRTVVASNQGNSTINVESPSGKISSQVYTYASGIAQEMTFYAGEEGLYKVYSTDEKLVVARVYREHTKQVTVTGSAIVPSDLVNYGLTFTNKQTGEITTTQVVNGSYSISLSDSYDYEVSLAGANGYVITSYNELSIAPGEENVNFDIAVGKVSLVTLTGNITGLSTEDLASLNLQFVSDSIYVPELNISDTGAYTLILEQGVTYNITAEGVNDYNLVGASTICETSDGTKDFTFQLKEKYPITIHTTGITESTKSNAVITFTNINEAGYTYAFSLKNTDIILRDGQYRVKVTGTGTDAIAMASTPDVIVSGTGVETTVDFNNLTNWDFSIYNAAFTGPGIENINEDNYYLGLKLSDTGIAENKTYLLLNSGGTIGVPANTGDIITVNYCNSGAFQFDSDSSTKVDEKSGSTSQIDTVSYTAKEDGYVTIEGISGENSTQTYFTSIQVTTPVTYKDTITVGLDGSCDYTTINDAIEAVRLMDRPNNERVTVEIKPGNYEEMLVIDMPNVTLKNASSNPSTDLTNLGVDIDTEAVRITSYYGHGYSYYSMGSDGKYNADTLAVNKANGYLSYDNPGAGTTNGSYWNATVVITGDGFEADGIIFENSFNQYISEKESKDILVENTGSKGERSKTAGDTTVQNKSFVERAAALAMANNIQDVYFNNCRFVGRQDTLYGGAGAVAAFYKCQVMGACDYIFGGMTAVFYKCKLIMNTSDDSVDVAYITAPQQTSGRGFLMYNCTVTSTTPGVDTASDKTSKPGYFGRPWQPSTSEVVFDKTIIQATDYTDTLESMIEPAGWLSTLGGESDGMYEYGTMECLENLDNSTNRVSWSKVITDGKLADGTDISTADRAISAFLGTDVPFEADTFDDTAETVTPTEPETPTVITLSADDIAAGTYTSSFEIGDFMITASGDKSVVVDGNSKTADDGKEFTQRIKLGGTGAADNRSIKFSALGEATLTIYAMSSSSGSDRALTLYHSEGTEVDSVTAYGQSLILGTIAITEAGDYYLASPSSGVNVYGVTLTYKGAVEEPDRADWSSVAAPVITNVVQNEEKIIISFDLVTGIDGADKGTVYMMDAEGTEIDNILVGTNSSKKREVEFTPEESGEYTFKVVAERTDEESVKTSGVSSAITFTLPLTAPFIKSVTNKGGGSVEVIWNQVKEAEHYVVSYQGENDTIRTVAATVTEESAIITGLTVGMKYTIFVKAFRGLDESLDGESEITISEEAGRSWSFSAFGQGVNTTDNYFNGSANDGAVTVASENGKGKLVPASTDGLAYYYTDIDPDTENFIISAKVTVDSWTYSNGQEGFGLMAADAVGNNGDSSVFWNNSFMNSVTKVEYNWDNENQKVSDTGDKITMKIGVGAQEKIGGNSRKYSRWIYFNQY